MRLSPDQRANFLATVTQFVEDLQFGRSFRKGLRVKDIKGIFEMTWLPMDEPPSSTVSPSGTTSLTSSGVSTHAIFTEP